MNSTTTIAVDDSLAARLAAWPKAKRDGYLDALSDDERTALLCSWEFWSRSDQSEPAGDWFVWLLLGGRGGGKTRVLTETLVSWVRQGYKRLFACAKSKGDVRDVLIETGPSALLNLPSTRGMDIVYEPSKRRVSFPSYGATITLLSGDTPSQARGPNFEAGICDELAAWQYPKRMLDNLTLCTRIGQRPKIAIATTPKPITILFDLIKDPHCHVTHSTTWDNSRNLSPIFLERVHEEYDDTTIGKQEVQGMLLSEMPGSCFKRANLEENMVSTAPDLKEVVIGLDPSGTSHSGSDQAGIVVCGIDDQKHGYVIEDKSGTLSPSEWASTAISLYHQHSATRVIYESNYGGDMIPTVIAAIDSSVKCEPAHASTDKKSRAQPVVSKSEQGKFHILTGLTDLIDELCAWNKDSNWSPGRLDAMVHALNYLFKRAKGPLIVANLPDLRRRSTFRGRFNEDPGPRRDPFAANP